MTINPRFELAKNFIVEGLAVKLDSPENAAKKGLQINIEPRVYYENNSYQARPVVGIPEAANSLNNLFSSALASKANQSSAINKNKFYANYHERKEDEELETKKDVVKKGVLGVGMKSLFASA